MPTINVSYQVEGVLPCFTDEVEVPPGYSTEDIVDSLIAMFHEEEMIINGRIPAVSCVFFIIENPNQEALK